MTRRSSSAVCSPRSSCPRSSTPTRSSSWSPASGRRRACSPRTRASSRACSGASRRRSPRTGSRRCRRRRRGSRRVVVLKGEDSLVAAPGSRRPRLRARTSVALDGGHGRRPHRRHGRVSREGDGAAAGSGGRVCGAAARLPRSGAALRPRRERRGRSVAVRARARLGPCTGARSRSTSVPMRHNARRLLEALDGAELWAVVKANGYGHGATDVGACGARRRGFGSLRRHRRRGPRAAPGAAGGADRS